MAHMIPQYDNTQKFSLQKPNGDSVLLDSMADACDYISLDASEMGNGESYTITCEKGWFARLSAPGYLDCTDWYGPYEHEHEARAFILEAFDIDPDTGGELEEDTDFWQGHLAAMSAEEEKTT